MGHFTFPQAQSGKYIRDYLQSVIKLDHKVVQSSWKLNKEVLIPFLKECGVKYNVMNNRYKGLNTADLQNSYIITEDKELWTKFKIYCKQKYYGKI